ncbi:hypothetical protein XOCgx_4297 [Xanthomonas oryzae pv. oryzicola]|nr:hypothetical protein XOCgx_4297 [Xanthomonas oryzae pv. oryzicola]
MLRITARDDSVKVAMTKRALRLRVNQAWIH